MKDDNTKASSTGSNAEDEPTFVDDLGVHDLRDVIFGKYGRLFSAAGRETPIAELTDDFLVLHPAQKPFADEGSTEDIVIRIDDNGILLDELGNKKKIAGTKFRGHEVFILGETKPDTTRHLAAWADEEGNLNKLFLAGDAVTRDMIYKLRIKTHDGELSVFSDLRSEGDPEKEEEPEPEDS